MRSYWYTVILAVALSSVALVLQALQALGRGPWFPFLTQGLWALFLIVAIICWIISGLIGAYSVGRKADPGPTRALDVIFISLHGIELTVLMTVMFQLGRILGGSGALVSWHSLGGSL